jgi:ribosomal protein S18 acetylase RimI-like enzyme
MNPPLRQLLPGERATVCAWAVGEQWPGLTKGRLIDYEEFVQILASPGHHSFALGEGRLPLIGFGQIWVAANGTVNLVRLLIDPIERGKGFGKLLCQLLLAQALCLPSTSRVKLRVRRDNIPAVAVYRALGFLELESESNEQVLGMAYEVLNVDEFVGNDSVKPLPDAKGGEIAAHFSDGR